MVTVNLRVNDGAFELHALFDSYVVKLLLTLLGVLGPCKEALTACLVRLLVLVDWVLQNRIQTVLLLAVVLFPILLFIRGFAENTRSSTVGPTEILLENSFLQSWLNFLSINKILFWIGMISL